MVWVAARWSLTVLPNDAGNIDSFGVGVVTVERAGVRHTRALAGVRRNDHDYLGDVVETNERVLAQLVDSLRTSSLLREELSTGGDTVVLDADCVNARITIGLALTAHPTIDLSACLRIVDASLRCPVHMFGTDNNREHSE
jgi:hypothetical protein